MLFKNKDKHLSYCFEHFLDGIFRDNRRSLFWIFWGLEMDENKTFFSTFDRVNNDGFLLVTYAGSHKGAKIFFEFTMQMQTC